MANLLSRNLLTDPGLDTIFYVIKDPDGTPTEGKMALSELSDLYATAAQGALADTAVQPDDLATVATTGAYSDLSGLPTLGTLAAINDAPSDGSQYARQDGAWAVVTGSGGGGAVDSVFGRTGAVVAQNGDYTASQVTNAAAVNATNTFTAAQTFNGGLTASDATYTNSERFGSGATIGADRCVVIGKNGSVTNPDSVAIGYGVSIGNLASGGSVVIGSGASSTDRWNVIIGLGATGTRESTAIGRQAAAVTATVAIGQSATASNTGTTAIGSVARATGLRSTALGFDAFASGTESIAIGYSPDAGADAALAIGYSASAGFASSIALGKLAATTKTQQLAIGSSAAPINEIIFPSGLPKFSQSSTTGARPVIGLEQLDVDEDFISFIGDSSASTADRSLVKPSDFPTPGAIVAWAKVKITDNRVGGIGTIDAWIPAYATPTV